MGRWCRDDGRVKPGDDSSLHRSHVADRPLLCGTRRNAGEAEMVAQRLALVVAPEQAAVLQFRHNESDEIGKGAGEVWGQNIT